MTFKKFFLATLLAISLFFGSQPMLVSAQPQADPDTLAGQQASGAGPQAWSEGYCQIGGVATIQGFECLITNVLSVIITVIGLAAFVMLIVSAFRYMLSGGNSKGIETSRNAITFAIVGIVIALSAFAILNLIAGFTGIEEVTQFTIPNSDTPSN